MKRISVAVLAAMITVSAGAGAHPPDKALEFFSKADVNHDGVIVLAEWKAAGRRERGFRIVDANGDGRVTLDELRSAMAKYSL